MNKTFIIKVNYGGLGDHLFYSHLPRIAKQSNMFNRVMISTQSEYRHPDYRRLIWEANPYVDGFVDEDAPYPEFGGVPAGMNLLDYIMIRRGLDDGKRFHEPELYYIPRKIQAMSAATIYDPNYVSNVGELDAAIVDRWFSRNHIIPDYMLCPRGKGISIRRYGSILETQSLEHYCSLIVSAKRFICLTSGGATLASALGAPATALWGDGQNPMFHHSKLHKYVHLRYASRLDRRVTKALFAARKERWKF